MKKRNAVYLLIAVLEGMLSGGHFYLARRDREPLNLLTGCMWLVLSIFHGLLGLQEEHVLLVEEEDYE